MAAGAIKTPPLSTKARIEAGHLLRSLQNGEMLPMPQSRAMPSIGKRCRELRINDATRTWRVVYRLDQDAIVTGDIFEKRTSRTPRSIIDNCRRRFADFDRVAHRNE